MRLWRNVRHPLSGPFWLRLSILAILLESSDLAGMWIARQLLQPQLGVMISFLLLLLTLLLLRTASVKVPQLRNSLRSFERWTANILKHSSLVFIPFATAGVLYWWHLPDRTSIILVMAISTLGMAAMLAALLKLLTAGISRPPSHRRSP